ncbi:hypothetical protein VB264_18290 [Arcicella aquatica]|uniref:Natural product n=1 Tax=Arcicella aquatica TaxID=217141 RepID=A0ABU5QRN7_9BACT|nr:hypothetical protein [Arcicella aquatica]MEA5259752.1 hypothetical protein [Arcicella aquatica]
MNNLMSKFSGLALTRTEMKKVKGGQCYYGGGSGNATPYPCSGLNDCKQAAADWGTNYCCSSCGSASWCNGGQCPQP